MVLVYDNVSFNYRRNEMLSARMKAAERGERTYHGSKCKNCGETKKATINATCVKCSNKKALFYVKRQRQKIKELLNKAKMDG